MVLFLVLCFSPGWRAMVSNSDCLRANMHSYCTKYGGEVKYKTESKKKKKKAKREPGAGKNMDCKINNK